LSAQERKRIEDAHSSGRVPDCPGCDVPLDRQVVEPLEGVSYVRHRVVLVCPSCGSHAALDQPRDRP
jgi:hypothetical protein